MKSASSALTALLATRQFWVADCYTFNFKDGTSGLYTSADANIFVGTRTFVCTGPAFDRSSKSYAAQIASKGGSRVSMHWTRGLQVDTLTFDVIPKDQDLLYGTTWFDCVRTGRFDGAEITLERAYMPTFGDTSPGTVTLFSGRVGDVKCVREVINFQVNSHLELFNQPFPRNLFQPTCSNTLGDASCTVNLENYAATGVTDDNVGAADHLYTQYLTTPSGYYDLGKIQITSGMNNGLWRSVKSYVYLIDGTSSYVAFTVPFPYPIETGASFKIYPGCNKSFTDANGCPKYANQANFRGERFIPAPETAV